MEAAGPPEGPHATLDTLSPDAFASVCEHLGSRDVAALSATASGLRHVVASNDRLWSGLYQKQFTQPWERLTQPQRGGGVLPGGWREAYLQTHTACQQLRSTGPACREWTTDASAVHLAAIHGSGAQRLVLTAQGSTLELRCAPPSPKSFQLYGHSGRVSCATVLTPVGGLGGGGGGGVQRVGIVTGSHDQTVRLWCGLVDPESYEYRSQPLSLLTPLRTLRGHQESVTCLQLVAGSTGVTIAATGGKDRTVRLWGLAPLVPSPVHKPQIATLRGHGAPVTCLALAGSSGSSGSSPTGSSNCDGGGTAATGASNSSSGGSGGTSGGSSSSGLPAGGWLVSGSLDSRVKCWDVWSGSAACTGTVKCAAPVGAIQPLVGDTELAASPHTLLVSGGSGVQLLDLRCMRAVGGVALPSSGSGSAGERGDTSAGSLHCFSQWGQHLALGASDGARVYDLRMLSTNSGSSSGSFSSGSSSGSSGSAAPRPCPERLRLTGHARPVTCIHMDRHKVVTATDRYGEAPVRAWCIDSGDCLAELNSCLPPQLQPQPESPAAAATTGGGGAEGGEPEPPVADGQGSLDAGWGEQLQQHQQAAATGAGTTGGSSGAGRQYHRGWEGVTALACRGALLLTGNSEGTVCERDYSRGGLPELEWGQHESGASSSAGLLVGKFWQYSGALND